MLRVAGLDVATRAGEPLLRGVELELAPGELLVLRGRSGLGKSTLLRALAALHGDPGEAVRLGDETPASLGTPRWRRRVTFTGAEAIGFEGSVRSNLERAFTYATAGAFDEDRALQGRAALGMAELMGREARELSTGERQRMHLLRGVMHRPDVALLDEPTSALDEESAEDARRYLAAVREEGVAMLVVAHRGFDGPTLDLERFRV